MCVLNRTKGGGGCVRSVRADVGSEGKGTPTICGVETPAYAGGDPERVLAGVGVGDKCGVVRRVRAQGGRCESVYRRGCTGVRRGCLLLER